MSAACAGAPRCASNAVTNKVFQAFRSWDKDNNGTISRDELKQVLLALGGAFSEQSVDAIMRAADVDKDGQIDYQNFINWCFGGAAPYVVLREFTPDGLRCLDGHELGEFEPSVEGWCCQECGDDLEVGSRCLQCGPCGGLAWCVRCAGDLSAAGDLRRHELDEAAKDEEASAGAFAAALVEETAERHGWHEKIRELMFRWPPPSRQSLEDVLAISAGLDDAETGGGAGRTMGLEDDVEAPDPEIMRAAIHDWLENALPPEEYTAMAELRRFLHDNNLEALMPHVEDGSIERLEQLRPGAGLDELAAALPQEAVAQLQVAGEAVADASAEELAQSLGWEDLVLDFSAQVPGVQKEELMEMLLSTAGLDGGAAPGAGAAAPGAGDEAMVAAVGRWLEQLDEGGGLGGGRQTPASRASRADSPILGGAPAAGRRSPSRSRPLSSGPAGRPAALGGKAPAAPATTSISVEVPVGARPGEVIRVQHRGLMLPVRVPPNAKPGAPLHVVVPAAAAARMLGVAFGIGDSVEVSLPDTDVHGQVGRVVSIQVEQGRIAVELGGRVLGFAPSSLREPMAVPAQLELSRYRSAPATTSFLATKAPARRAAGGPVLAVLEEAPASAPAPPMPVLERSKSMNEACMGESFGAYPPHDFEKAAGTCAICMEEKEVVARLCETDDCQARLCEGCVEGFASSMVQGAFYSMPFLRCPGCRARLQSGVWLPFVKAELLQKYTQVGTALTEFRCGGCHQSRTLWGNHDPKLREGRVFSKLRGKSVDAVRSAWQQFSRDRVSSAFLWSAILNAYGVGRVGDAAGGDNARTVPEQVPLTEILGLIIDDERRLMLHLAALRDFPRIHTYCCGAYMCFGCKVAWHRGKSCEEMRRKETGKDVQFCPHCGVAVVKSEGCNHMVCVCGKHWQWGANPNVARLIRAIVSRNVQEIRAVDAAENVAVEALQSVSWDGHDFAPILPTLLQCQALRGVDFLGEVWRITTGMGRTNARAVLKVILERWPADRNPAALWGVALGGHRAVSNGTSGIDLLPLLQDLLDAGGRDPAFLAELWQNFVASGVRVRAEKKLELAEVLGMIIDHRGSTQDTNFLAQLLNASCVSQQRPTRFRRGGPPVKNQPGVVSPIHVLQVLLQRAGTNATFVAAAWQAALGTNNGSISDLKLESAQVEEAFRLILKHCGSDQELLASLLGPGAAAGHLTSMKALLEKKVDPDTSGSGSCPALVVAAGRAQPQAAQMLLDFRANVNAFSLGGDGSALHAVLRNAATLNSAFDGYRAANEKDIVVKYKDEGGASAITPGKDISWQPRPKPLGPGRGNRGGGGGRRSPAPRRGGPVQPAGAYRLNGAAAHPAVAASTLAEGPARQAGVQKGDVLVAVKNSKGGDRSEVELAKADAGALVARVAMPATLVFRRGFKAHLAAVELDWQARAMVVDLLCAAGCDVHGSLTLAGGARTSPLLVAAGLGLGAAVSTLLQYGAGGNAPDAADSDRLTGTWLAPELCAACTGGHAAVAQLLLSHKAELGPAPGLRAFGDSESPAEPLMWAMRHLRKDPELWDLERFETPAQQRLAEFPVLEFDWPARVDIAKRLLAARASPHAGSDGAVESAMQQRNPLFWAADAGCAEAAELLSKRGGLIQGRGMAALQMAAAGARADDVLWLLRLRAQPDAADAEFGPTNPTRASPLAAAAGGSPPVRGETVQKRQERKRQWDARMEIARKLLEARADVDRSACGSGSAAGADLPEVPSEETPPPLRAAAATGHFDMVKLLLGARAEASTTRGGACVVDCVKQALTWPREWEDGEEEIPYIEPQPPQWFNRWQRDNFKVAQWRRFRNDRVRRREQRQKRLRLERAVHEADTSARVAIVKALCEAGASPARGGTALAEAARRGATALVALLLRLGARIDWRLQWCPKCRRPLLLQAPLEPLEPGEEVQGGDVKCGCGAKWPLAAGPFQSLIAAAQDELLRVILPLEGIEAAKDAWPGIANLLVACAERTIPARAPAWGNGECTKIFGLMVKLKANVDALLPRGGTMLRVASAAGHVEAVKALLDLSANPNSPAASRMLREPEWGKTPLQAAVKGARYLEAPGGGPCDLALDVAAACGGPAKLPEEVERQVVYAEEGALSDLLWEKPPADPPAGGGGQQQQQRRSTARGRGAAGRSGQRGRGNASPRGSPRGGAPRSIEVGEVKPGGPAAAAELRAGDRLVAACGADSVELRGAALGQGGAAAVEKMLAKLEAPITLTFAGKLCTYLYEESVHKALTLGPTAHGHLRVEGLLVTPGRDAPDADEERCEAVVGRIVGAIDGADVTHLGTDELWRRLEKKGLSISFLSALAEAEVIRHQIERRRSAIVELLCIAKADVTGAAPPDSAELPVVLAARAGLAALSASGTISILAQHGAKSLESALGVACETGSATAVDLLLNRKASPDQPTAVCGGAAAAPLLLAVRGRTTPIARQWSGWTFDTREAVERAARMREEIVRLGICERLIGRRADPSRAGTDGLTALHWAASSGRESAVRMLLRLGAPPAPRPQQSTALHSVVTALPSNTELVVGMLLEHSAPVDAEDTELATPLLCAVRCFAPPSKRGCVKEGAAEEPEDLGFWPAGLWPEEVRRLACVELLLASRADIGRAKPESCLHAAVRLSSEGDGRVTPPWLLPEKLLRLKAPPDARDSTGRSPLRLAVECGAADALDLLLSLGIPLELGSPLCAAVIRGNLELTKRLLRCRADASVADGLEQVTPLHLAAERAHSEVMAALLEEHADPRKQDVSGRTPLEALVSGSAEEDVGAAAEDRTRAELAKELLRCGAQVDACNGPEGCAPLYVAANKGRTRILRVLLDWKADISQQSASGGSILHFIVSSPVEATSSDQLRELVSELLRRSARVDAVDKEKLTPLHLAARAGRADALLTLTTKQGDPEARDAFGRTPLHMVAESNADADGVKELLKWLVDPRQSGIGRASDRAGRTALHHAAAHGQLAFLAALLDRKADHLKTDSSGATALHLAAQWAVTAPSVDAAEGPVHALLAANACTQLVTEDGRTPLELARRKAEESGDYHGMLARLSVLLAPQ